MHLFNILTILYFSFPFVVFLMTWISRTIKVLIALPFLVSLFLILKKNSLVIVLKKQNKKRFFICFILIAFWVYLSGIGKTVYQNNDSYVRNGILEVLVSNSWPVVKRAHRTSPVCLGQSLLRQPDIIHLSP